MYRRLLKPVKIRIGDVCGVALLTRSQLSGSLRIWASGGLPGYYGWFTGKKLGKAMWYATRLDQAVAICTYSKRKYLISPDDIELFLSQLPDGIIKKRP